MPPTDRRRSRASAPSESRAERRRAAQTRRHRTMLVGATVIATVVMAAWFPASDLLHQHEQLAAATTELQRLDHKNQTLKKKATELETPSALGRIAQQQYDLVSPGDQAYQVLPASGAGEGSVPGTSSSGTSSSADGAHSGSHGTATSATSGDTTESAATSTTSGGFLSRVLQTLEFWR